MYTDAVQIPPVVTEFGATGDRAALIENVDLFDQARLGWFNWTYLGGDPATVAKDPNDQAIVVDAHQPRSGGNVREANLDALVRPYPKLTAGTPIEWHYDVAAHRFTYRWDTGRADRGGRFPDGSVTAISTPPGRTLAATTLKSSVAVSFPRRVRPSSRSRRARGAAEVSIVVELGDGPAQQGC